MTSEKAPPPDDALEVEIEQLENENLDLQEEIEDLREEGLFIDPYATPHEVAEALTRHLAGWQAKRWRELATLIEDYVRGSVDV